MMIRVFHVAFAALFALAAIAATDAPAQNADKPRIIPFPVPKPKFNLRAPNFQGDDLLNIPRAPYDPTELGHLSPEMIEPSRKPYAILPRARDLCPVNISVAPSFRKPDQIEPTNNLRRKNGQYETAEGHYAEFRGVVRDRDCVPVKNAIVRLWQRDNNGGHIELYEYFAEDRRLHPDYDRHFAYSGTAVTDNRGEFSFLTVLPGTESPVLPPHVNIEVTHDFFETLVTRIYLLPNREPGFLTYDIDPGNPFRMSDVPTLMHPPGETASSEIITTHDKRHGLRFYVNLSLAGKDAFRNF